MFAFKKYLNLALPITVAIILVQTLRFKLTGNPDSVAIFKKINMEPEGRIGVGLLELVTSALIVIPRTAWLGAALTMGIMGGAITKHLTTLGIEVPYNGKPDKGMLFATAILTFTLSAIVLYQNRKDIPIIGEDLEAIEL